MVGWHHQLNGHEFEKGQESLACCSPRGHEESDTIEQLNDSNSNRSRDYYVNEELYWYGHCRNRVNRKQNQNKERASKELEFFNEIKLENLAELNL